LFTEQEIAVLSTFARASAQVWEPRVLDIARRAPFAHVAVQTAGGPHVTPVLYALTPDRLWLVVQRATLKARVLAARPQVGVLLDAGTEGVAIRGVALLIDPLSPTGLLARAPELARAPCAVPSYLTRNAPELLAFPRDLGLRPPDIVFASIRIDELAVVERPAIGETAAPGAVLEAAGVPDALRAYARSAGPVVVGWETAAGPLALPAAWDPLENRASTPAGSLSGTDAQVCVCFDKTRGRGPAAKTGLLLRGRGHAARQGETAAISVETERITWWDGFRVATVPVAAPLPAAA
jgi:pyridoxamine 5'-phosphate oxidase-like protein